MSRYMSILAVLLGSGQTLLGDTTVVVVGDIDKFGCQAGWTPAEGNSGCDVGTLPIVPDPVDLDDEAATDVQLANNDPDLTLTFHFAIPAIGITSAYIEFWGLDIEARAGVATNKLSLDGNTSVSAFALKEAVAGFNDYVTLTRYDLDSSELALLNDGLLEAELFLPAPGGGGDSIAFDFVRLVVEGQSIPTVSTWGLMVMVLLLLATGTLVMTRPKPRAG